MTPDDRYRELAKAVDAVRWAVRHEGHHAEANAALHCNPEVFHSPLHKRLQDAVDGIERVMADISAEYVGAAAEGLARPVHGLPTGEFGRPVCVWCGREPGSCECPELVREPVGETGGPT